MTEDKRESTCVHCGRRIVRPKPGSYPPSVRWVHVRTSVGMGNRYCDMGGTTAAPILDRKESNR